MTHNHNDNTDDKEKLLSKSELSIWLDRYDDIFSDFDSRHFSERALSDDFIYEARKMAREKLSGVIELKLLIPDKLRQKQTEEIIIKNLHAYFRRHAHLMQDEMSRILRKGILLSLLGVFIMVCTVYIVGIGEKSFVMNALRVILEPAGWFFAWTGLDNIFYQSKKKKTDFNFMNRMAHSEIEFLSF